MAAVPQDATGAFGLTVRETVAMGHSPHKRFWEGDTAEDAAQCRAALDRVGAAHLADRRLDELSGGERQRALIARALVQRPRILALDEPTNHLDIRYQLDILHLARTLPPTVLVVLHDLNLAAAYCDRLYVLAMRPRRRHRHPRRGPHRGTPARRLRRPHPYRAAPGDRKAERGVRAGVTGTPVRPPPPGVNIPSSLSLRRVGGR